MDQYMRGTQIPTMSLHYNASAATEYLNHKEELELALAESLEDSYEDPELSKAEKRRIACRISDTKRRLSGKSRLTRISDEVRTMLEERAKQCGWKGKQRRGARGDETGPTYNEIIAQLLDEHIALMANEKSTNPSDGAPKPLNLGGIPLMFPNAQPLNLVPTHPVANNPQNTSNTADPLINYSKYFLSLYMKGDIMPLVTKFMAPTAEVQVTCNVPSRLNGSWRGHGPILTLFGKVWPEVLTFDNLEFFDFFAHRDSVHCTARGSAVLTESGIRVLSDGSYLRGRIKDGLIHSIHISLFVSPHAVIEESHQPSDSISSSNLSCINTPSTNMNISMTSISPYNSPDSASSNSPPPCTPHPSDVLSSNSANSNVSNASMSQGNNAQNSHHGNGMNSNNSLNTSGFFQPAMHSTSHLINASLHNTNSNLNPGIGMNINASCSSTNGSANGHLFASTNTNTHTNTHTNMNIDSLGMNLQSLRATSPITPSPINQTPSHTPYPSHAAHFSPISPMSDSSAASTVCNTPIEISHMPQPNNTGTGTDSPSTSCETPACYPPYTNLSPGVSMPIPPLNPPPFSTTDSSAACTNPMNSSLPLSSSSTQSHTLNSHEGLLNMSHSSPNSMNASTSSQVSQLLNAAQMSGLSADEIMSMGTMLPMNGSTIFDFFTSLSSVLAASATAPTGYAMDNIGNLPLYQDDDGFFPPASDTPLSPSSSFM
eukprot:TRINITY_DN18781_c0_g1::TRINITY_DN18781_c0_g1_i1::g.15285::m.15285 TRINITY_DN18781_c0_g1::TRINITY_DN18781_c0_g1_i1::g.15285  ORF type:complete len:714 (+),score=81.81 TRINITY_DN18781_c0_g1_i1:79-2220(+)